MKIKRVFIAFILLCATSLTACNRSSLTLPDDSSEQAIFAQFEEYTNSEIGIRIEIPLEWKDKYTIEPGDSENSIRIFSNICRENGWGGFICSVTKETLTKWVEEDERGLTIPVVYRLLAETPEYAYVMTFAGDVNYNPADETQTKEYWDMRAYFTDVQIKLQGSQGK